MKTIIAGSRGITDYEVVHQAMGACPFTSDITEVLSGAARGVDMLGAKWALMHTIPVRYFRADWNFYGRQAGALRNLIMANNADALVAVWDGQSRGTAHMIKVAKLKGLKLFVYEESIK